MPDPKNLPHLIKLLDDESPLVQKAVTDELLSFGAALENELEKLSELLSMDQKARIRFILEENSRNQLRSQWSLWKKEPNEISKLEKAFHLISEFQNGPDYPVELTTLLDGLAEDYRQHYQQDDPVKLASFLFKVKQFGGAHSDYYNSSNSNLVYVIEQKRGIPISLVCIYMLVGARLGIKIDGCNFPGHFLARIDVEGHYVYVDCFNGGRFLDEKNILSMNQESAEVIQEILQEETSAEVIMIRVLNNLRRAYELADQATNRELMEELLKTLDQNSE